MRKALSILLAVILLVSVSGCSGDALDFELGGLTVDNVVVNPSNVPPHDIVGDNHTFPNTGAQYFVNANGAFSDASAYAAAAANITGFPWNPDQQALKYSGSSYLTNSTANFRSADTSGAIEVWFRSNTTANFHILFSSSDTGTTTSYAIFYIGQTTGQSRINTRNAAGVSNAIQGNTVVTDGKRHHILFSSNGTNWTIFVDGVAETLGVLVGSNTGDWFGDVTLRDNITIGAKVDSAGSSLFTIGDIGVTRIYSRPVLLAEALTNYQRGRKAVASNTTGLVYNLNLNEQSGNPVDKVGSLTMTRAGTILPTWLNSDGVFVAQGKTVNFLNTLTFNGTDGTTMLFPTTSQTIPGVGQTNNWTASQNMTGQKITTLAAPTANGDAVRYENLTLPNAMLSSSANQTTLGIAFTNNVTFNSNDQLVGITHSTSSNTSQIWTQEAGAYEFAISVIVQASAVNKHIDIWFRKNGVDVAKSNTKVELPLSGETIIPVPVIFQLLAGEYIELIWASDDDATMKLLATNTQTTPTRPASPSVIMTVKKVSK